MVRRPVDLAELRRMRLRELRSMGMEKIQQEISKAEWKNDFVIARKIQQHQLEWGRADITIKEFKEISRRIKSNPDSIIYRTYANINKTIDKSI
ncbi:hypothetical protein FJZ31_04655 [Candidatus Poribacteria bacterium]|nr:hypothetical protein [Candidatus Poribacteria bacterium]